MTQARLGLLALAMISIGALGCGGSERAGASSGSAQESPRPDPVPNGPCTSDADCGWDNDCVPHECVAHPPGDQPPCEESAPPPGTCTCIASRCTLTPNAE